MRNNKKACRKWLRRFPPLIAPFSLATSLQSPLETPRLSGFPKLSKRKQDEKPKVTMFFQKHIFPPFIQKPKK
jgi:hypothetical protein